MCDFLINKCFLKKLINVHIKFVIEGIYTKNSVLTRIDLPLWKNKLLSGILSYLNRVINSRMTYSEVE